MIKNKEKFSSALISDTLLRMGYKNQLLSPQFKSNFENAFSFGPVRTLKLKSIETGDNPQDIHKGLHLLERMQPGELIVISNGFQDMAFFGELMSTIALQKGVKGAIIDGVTRDRKATRDLQFPVFSKGTHPMDLANKAIIEDIDCEVEIDGITIKPGDYLCCDSDGVVLIPKDSLKECIERAEKLLVKEDEIKEQIRRGIPMHQIIDKWGNF